MAAEFDPFVEEAGSALAPNELLIGLCGGRDLAIRDTSMFSKGGSSDPRCVFSIAGRPDLKVQSTVKKKTLEPHWGETFALEIGADEVKAPTLNVRCEDYDVGSAADSMGIFTVPLGPLANARTRAWYDLEVDPTSDEKVSGAIELVLRWRHNPALAFEPFGDITDDPSKPPNELRIGLGRGRDLVVKDTQMFGKGGSSDPRCVFTIPGTDGRVRSKVVRKSLNPRWNETFALPVAHTHDRATLRVLCEDHDDLSAADSMGVFSVPLAPLADHGARRDWHALEVDPSRPKDKVSGAVELYLKWVHNAELAFDPFVDDADALDKPPNELLVALIRGRDLAIKDKNLLSKGGTSDPQVVFTVPGTELGATSTYKNNTLAPLWNETFALPLEAGAVDHPRLRCLCQDYDDLSAPDSMGVLEIPVERARRRGWHPLGVDPKRPKDAVSGALEVVTRWVHNPELAFEPFADATDVADEAPNELLVGLARGRDLVVKDKNLLSAGGSSDPRVRFLVLGTDNGATSRVKKKTLHPRWNETFALHCTPNEKPVLRCTCEDYDALSAADSMGVADVDVAPFADRAVHRAWFPLAADPDRPKDAVSGALELVFRWRHNAALAYEPFREPKKMSFATAATVLRREGKGQGPCPST